MAATIPPPNNQACVFFFMSEIPLRGSINSVPYYGVKKGGDLPEPVRR